jgi:two-component system response regulator FlrC
MSSFNIAQHALWLDPVQPLAAPEHAQLALAGLSVHRLHTLEDIQKQLTDADWIVVRLDGSLERLQAILGLQQQANIQVPVICRVDRQHLSLAVQAMRRGAFHVMAADEWSVPAWQAALHKPETKSSTASVAVHPPAPQRSVVYVDPVSRHLLALAQRVAKAQVTALIEGPTGAGKEVLARVLHESSNRVKGPFVGLNCAALPEQLIDDMLFGHEKGAFTGAHKDFKGLFEQAQGGTLFLDEIGEMPMHLQAKLLRVLQERQLTRLGAERPVAVDVRVVAATNKDLRQAILAREFREDLYFRISTFKLRVPALRDRPGDILPLVAQLLARHAKDATFTVSAQAQAQLLSYAWPGNVRELENVVQRAVVLCTDSQIEAMHLMFDEPQFESMPTAHDVRTVAETRYTSSPPAEEHLQAAPHYAGKVTETTDALCDEEFKALFQMPVTHSSSPVGHLQTAVKSNEHQLIMAAIQNTESRIEAARQLGISPRTLRYKLAKLKGDNMSGSMALAR